MKRNTWMLSAALAILALLAGAGWLHRHWRAQRTEPHSAEMAKQTLRETGPAEAASPLVGRLAPAFTLENIAGQQVHLEDFRGKAVLLNFWATWCGPCRIETPWLIELRNRYDSQGFEVVGVSAEGEDRKPGDRAGLERQRAAVKKFATAMKIPYPVLIDGDSIAATYGGVDAMPTSFYLDRHGRIVAVQMGLHSKAEMESNLQKALGK